MSLCRLSQVRGTDTGLLERQSTLMQVNGCHGRDFRHETHLSEQGTWPFQIVPNLPSQYFSHSEIQMENVNSSVHPTQVS
jgi:hypothetical protein